MLIYGLILTMHYILGPIQCRINHMAEAAYAAGPTLLVAPRPLSSIFSEFFVSCFSAGPKQSASAGPQRAQVHQNFKSEAAKSGASNVFPLFQYFSAGPQRAQGPQKDVRPQNLKM
jgi:hypothetical protein